MNLVVEKITKQYKNRIIQGTAWLSPAGFWILSGIYGERVCSVYRCIERN